MIVDEKTGVKSVEVRGERAVIVDRGGDTSVTMGIARNQISDPVVWPMVGSNNYILIGDDSGEGDVRRDLIEKTGVSYFNPRIDSPLSLSLPDVPSTYLALSIRDSQSDKVLAVIHLILRANNFRFMDSDIKHLHLISEHLS